MLIPHKTVQLIIKNQIQSQKDSYTELDNKAWDLFLKESSVNAMLGSKIYFIRHKNDYPYYGSSSYYRFFAQAQVLLRK